MDYNIITIQLFKMIATLVNVITDMKFAQTKSVPRLRYEYVLKVLVKFFQD